MFKGRKETIFKDIKENMKIMSHQIKDIKNTEIMKNYQIIILEWKSIKIEMKSSLEGSISNLRKQKNQ